MLTRTSIPLVFLGFLALMPISVPLQAQTSDLVPSNQLRVCADPNNLPFSNEKGEGFENKIAELIGRDLNLPVSYVWFPQVIGFVRNTLQARRCDLIVGTVAGDGLVQTTNPYYYTSYVMIYRADKGLDIATMADAKLKTLSIGVVAGTPPSDLLVRHKLMDRVHPYALMVDTRYESPTHQMIQDIMDGKVDVGLLWGPFAGYYVQRDKLPLTLVPLENEPGAPRVDYHIAMGVRPNEPEWRRKINEAILKEHDAIVAVLKDYGVPLLDEQGKPVQ
jgi:quinoprotein dehydrogenase-associated probable ABC transporter substrate-binding protein